MYSKYSSHKSPMYYIWQMLSQVLLSSFFVMREVLWLKWLNLLRVALIVHLHVISLFRCCDLLCNELAAPCSDSRTNCRIVLCNRLSESLGFWAPDSRELPNMCLHNPSKHYSQLGASQCRQRLRASRHSALVDGESFVCVCCGHSEPL